MLQSTKTSFSLFQPRSSNFREVRQLGSFAATAWRRAAAASSEATASSSSTATRTASRESGSENNFYSMIRQLFHNLHPTLKKISNKKNLEIITFITFVQNQVIFSHFKKYFKNGVKNTNNFSLFLECPLDQLFNWLQLSHRTPRQDAGQLNESPLDRIAVTINLWIKFNSIY